MSYSIVVAIGKIDVRTCKWLAHADLRHEDLHAGASENDRIVVVIVCKRLTWNYMTSSVGLRGGNQVKVICWRVDDLEG